ncbi:unnamed protein product [Lampetra planeri]
MGCVWEVPPFTSAPMGTTWLMGLRHTVGQWCAERGGAERLTGEELTGERVRGAHEEELMEERAGHARGDAGPLSGPAGCEEEWKS